MRRELKLVFLILVLIVGPSATLSFLAGRVLGNWQIVLRDQMAGEAARVLDTVAATWVANLNGLRESMANGLVPTCFPAGFWAGQPCGRGDEAPVPLDSRCVCC